MLVAGKVHRGRQDSQKHKNHYYYQELAGVTKFEEVESISYVQRSSLYIISLQGVKKIAS